MTDLVQVLPGFHQLVKSRFRPNTTLNLVALISNFASPYPWHSGTIA